ncbi:MAG: AmmeMemoRadiSam system radical SAM enzyme [Candidatus Omnitrophica bacterium]|nr:AmmeMemoRadiSam system radical SAM enzyme [Candidatus Omnitrophota bacterium]MCM8799468.1 AmmeMemoRadiSam system radical SAM enzyme [Candidatus Omnitrophota bacterium]
MKEALLYEKLENNSVRCFLCNHNCQIKEGSSGICRVRKNIKGKLYSLIYGKPCALHIDPIEKKPFYHFFPGSFAFSLATFGCNFKCGFCQNWQISQEYSLKDIESQQEILPSEVVELALKNKCKSISYTYTEPTVFFEYALEIARLSKEKGLYNNFVTNGYMTKEALDMIKPYLDAANVDLKFFKENSYRKNCKANLEPVKESITYMRKLGIWVEVTTLVIPDENDSEEELTQLARFLAGVDKNIIWHVSKFHPDYQYLNYNVTSESTLRKAQDIGYKAGLNYVYVGNVWGWGNDTICHNCKKLLIKREYFSILEYNLKGNRCPYCNTVIPGLF